uniref:Genome sequencing data, contig C296 n=1 Tax=Microcystis aeruginosa (strain PCC 7806) TaxID=267872 RepID=A8YDZ9_MICA7|nr:unnamed protein product [Microcystis aeruginosa PCC 7806]
MAIRLLMNIWLISCNKLDWDKFDDETYEYLETVLGV